MIEQFHFLRPGWLLLLIPLLAGLWLLFKSRYDSGNWRAVIDARLLPFVLSDGRARRREPMRWIFAAAALLTIVALAGPTWEKLPQPVYHKQTALVIALDLSRSMNTNDIKPSRLARARHKIADVLDLRIEGQTALLVYAADAFAVTPLTSDIETIKALLPAIDSEMMPAQGSRADRAVELAFELLSNGGVRRGDVLLITDGISDLELGRVENQLAEKPGHRLSVLAIGTRDGGPIPLHDGGFLKDRDGAIVIAAMQQRNLRRVAQIGGGVYATISTDDIDINTLAYLMESSIDERAARLADRSADLWRELGPWLLLGVLPIAALVFRRGLIWLLPVFILVAPPDAHALDWQSWWQNTDQRAGRLFEQGEHAAAAELFEQPEWQASARYKSGDYAAALETWQRLEGETALYNRANALAQLGRFEEALSAYGRLLRDNPEHEDARFNKQAIEALLEQQQQQQQQQQDGVGDPQNGRQHGERQDSQADGSQQNDGQQQPQNRQSESQSQPSGQDGTQAAGAAAEAESESQTGAGEGDPSAAEPGQLAEPGESDPSQSPDSEAQAVARLEEQMSEQAAEQWLRKIPDDPGGLLRRKFLYQYRKRGGVDPEAQSW